MIALSNATLSHLPATVTTPSYNRRDLRPRIVHIGVGNFHRTHQALYLDDVLNTGGEPTWGICGVGLTDGPEARAKAAAYHEQDCLYTVSEFTPEGAARTRVIGAMIDYLHAPANPEAVLARLADPETSIVTLTITEGGYNIDEATGRFLLENETVRADLAGGQPKSAFGFVVEALARRRRAGLPGFTIASCDNLRGNGDTARKAFVAFAQARNPELADWIDREVDFPNSMVDRIAPQIPASERDALNARSGVDDLLPAKAESFNQWVVEDRFRQGRPLLETVGVEFRDNVAAYVAVKGRMINACHMLLAYPSVLMGQRIVHEGMRERRIITLLGQFLDRDVIPFVDPPPGLDLAHYKTMIVERFSNPAIGDQLLRVAGDGAAKLPIFHGKTLATLIAAGADIRREAFLMACFGRYLLGRDDKGTSYEVFEPGLTAEDWRLVRSAPTGVLVTSPFKALGLIDDGRFRSAFEGFAGDLIAKKTSATLDGLLRSSAV